MWGHILTEASTQQNFNFGFSTYKSEILIHLSQWQYWWWFWFSIWWTLYYFIIFRVISKRTFNFNVVMNTSLRGRGKWGDFLVALIPVSWCCNILINSNFILRMIEWQNESSLFTIRIQGKQWYWVYKYDPNTAQAVITTPKNIGHNRWRVISGQESYNADTYYQAIHLAAHLEFQNSYSKFTRKIDTHRKNLNTLTLSNEKIKLSNSWNTSSPTTLINKYDEQVLRDLEETIAPILKSKPRTDSNFKFRRTSSPTALISKYDEQVLRDLEETIAPILKSKPRTNSKLDSWRIKDSRDTVEKYRGETLHVLEETLDPSFRHTNNLYTNSTGFRDFFPRSKNTVDVTTSPSLGLKKQRKKFYTYGNITMYDIYQQTGHSFNEQTFQRIFNSRDNFNAFYDFLLLDETTDADSNTRHFSSTQPFRLLKGVLNSHVSDILQNEKFIKSKLNKLLLFNTKFSQGGESLKDKELLTETLWGFRQKKYKKLKKFKFKPEVIYDPITFEIIGQKAIVTSPKVDIAGVDLYKNSYLKEANIDKKDIQIINRNKAINDNFNYKLATRINRHRSELVPVTLARRLLRTKRTLVLPAHVNLTLITNSYDVVHSWFVPGLGLKIDCVPGRSTHHTLYIDNIGFYYGQCAEICGRYHHHMPIRLCALPFEHFVVWWQAKGTARMNRTTEINNNRFLNYKFNNAITREKLIYRMN